MDDPDAPTGTFTHWALMNLPAATRSLPEDVPTMVHLEGGALQRRNSTGQTGYTGACPPSGMHHYHFTIYALNAALGLGSDASGEQLRAALRGHVLGQGELTGTHQR
jgi:Raf kinase inhibitor-like YbhB/YbcL family protein